MTWGVRDEEAFLKDVERSKRAMSDCPADQHCPGCESARGAHATALEALSTLAGDGKNVGALRNVPLERAEARIAELEASRDRALVEGLKKYGAYHTQECSFYEMPDDRCDCGYSALLAQHGGKP